MADTPLDRAHVAMEAAGDDTGRLRFYERLVDAELCLLLTGEPEGDAVEPDLFEVEGGKFALVFDTEERLAEFAERTVPYVAMSGRALVGMLVGQGIGLALNPGVAPSAFLLPGEAVDWLAGTLAQEAAPISARPVEISAPREVPEVLLTALDAKLAACGGLAKMAYLAAVTYAPARPGMLLAFIEAAPGAEGALARAVSEAVIFSGVEAAALDVGVFEASDPMAARLAKVGLRFDLPGPEASPGGDPVGPGMDPERPPKLR